MRRLCVIVVMLTVGCASVERTQKQRRNCADRGETIRVEITGSIHAIGSLMQVPTTVTNRTKGRVTRIRYVIGFFNSIPPSLDAIRRVERQMDLVLEPGAPEAVTFESDHRNDPRLLGQGSPICFGVRAVPVEIDGVRVPQAEAWAFDTSAVGAQPSGAPTQPQTADGGEQ
jgi:hypothetical protein